ncbi:SDR family NAD(P)-dependent oxidoreductase [Phenylobacterium sp.]|jgi:NAD(P)-dependent dehydrogenase (short-subunit alcohol dehydrogenase family)|uniref:SDR family NAD(P)-dependent oxidoreductase n=1 Tax=Phenylobacterium sp. TaxID=1871053 RepID=UPI002F3FBA88
MSGADQLLGLQDAVVLVTGSGSGIGKATALLYAQAGAQVACCDIGEAAAAATVAEIAGKGGRAIVLHADVTRQADVRAMVAETEARLGPLEVAVNVVGGFGGAKPRPFMDLPLEEWEMPLRVNLTGTMLCCQAEGIAMARRGTQGRIVNFASSSGIAASPSIVHYGAAKAAVMHLTKSVALEYAEYGIRVNCVVPGTHWTAGIERQATDPETGARIRAFAERVREQTPLKRMGETWETAGAALFLGSKLSSYMTGHIVISDGGVLHTTARGGVSEGMTPKALE